MALQRGNQGVAYLMVGDGRLLFVGQHRIFLLVARNDGLDALFEVLLVCNLAAASNRAERRFVDDVRKLCAGGTGGHARNRVEVYIVREAHLLGVHLEDFLSAL